MTPSNGESHREAEIHVVPYDVAWPVRFEAERDLLLAAIPCYVVGSVEHVGSTAIPGLPAKPVIDIMIGVESLAASQPALILLAELGYRYAPYRAEVMHWLCKPSMEVRTHHLHLVPFGSTLWFERIAFRDYLRVHASAAAEYADLKIRLAALYRFDREAYTNAKAPFVERIVRLALATRQSSPPIL